MGKLSSESFNWGGTEKGGPFSLGAPRDFEEFLLPLGFQGQREVYFVSQEFIRRIGNVGIGG